MIKYHACWWVFFGERVIASTSAAVCCGSYAIHTLGARVIYLKVMCDSQVVLAHVRGDVFARPLACAEVDRCACLLFRVGICNTTSQLALGFAHLVGR